MDKFLFDQEFSGAPSKAERAPPRKRTYRPEEVDAERAAAYAKGTADATAEAERQAAAALGAIAAATEETISAIRLEMDRQRDDSVRLAVKIAQRFVAAVAEEAPELFLERCFEECLDIARSEPRILIEVPDIHAERIVPRLQDMAHTRGLDSALTIKMTAGRRMSARIDWGSGGAEIALDEAFRQIDETIEKHLTALNAVGGTQDERARKAG